MATPTGVKKAVLAYSGGLDTSVILPWLREAYGCEVVAFVADLGQGTGELEGIVEKARKSGACEVFVEDLREEFVTEYLWPMLKAGAIYEGKYLLGTSIARPLIAKKQVEVARATGADAVAHGATGKGNDQVRFELTYQALAPDLAVLVPWRDPRWKLTSREAAVEYAEAHGIPIAQSKKSIYSRDRNLWHISHEGAELENPANEPSDKVFVLGPAVEKAPDKAEYIDLEYEAGVPVAVNGKRLGPVEIVEEANRLGAKHAIGVVDLVENRLVGIKSRGVYETPGGTILYAGHAALEALCLDRDTLHYKQGLALRYAELVYYGQWFSMLREAMDAFIAKTQETVTGKVRLKLYKGQAHYAGAESPLSLYSEDLASFVMGKNYNPQDATGFIHLFGLPMKVRGLMQAKSSRLSLAAHLGGRWAHHEPRPHRLSRHRQDHGRPDSCRAAGVAAGRYRHGRPADGGPEHPGDRGGGRVAGVPPPGARRGGRGCGRRSARYQRRRRGGSRRNQPRGPPRQRPGRPPHRRARDDLGPHEGRPEDAGRAAGPDRCRRHRRGSPGSG